MKTKKIEYPKLPAKFKAKWLKALRGGEYEQCKGALYDNGKFCCIGVECHLHGVSKTDLGFRKTMGGTKDVFDRVPKYMDVIKQAENPSNSAQQFLIEMNDSGKSFKQIANWIERNL